MSDLEKHDAEQFDHITLRPRDIKTAQKLLDWLQRALEGRLGEDVAKGRRDAAIKARLNILKRNRIPENILGIPWDEYEEKLQPEDEKNYRRGGTMKALHAAAKKGAIDLVIEIIKRGGKTFVRILRGL